MECALAPAGRGSAAGSGAVTLAGCSSMQRRCIARSSAVEGRDTILPEIERQLPIPADVLSEVKQQVGHTHQCSWVVGDVILTPHTPAPAGCLVVKEADNPNPG